MNINTDTMQNFQVRPAGVGRPEGVGKPDGIGRPMGAGQDSVNVSSMGQMMSNLSEADTKEMQEFKADIARSIKSGDFDATTMAENAPEALKTFAAENDIELDSMLNQISEKMAGTMNGSRMRPQGMGIPSAYTQESDPTTTLLESLLEENESNETESV
jgi:hypothetical protein